MKHFSRYRDWYCFFIPIVWLMLLILLFYKIQSDKELVQVFTDPKERHWWVQLWHILTHDREDYVSVLVNKHLLIMDWKYIVLYLLFETAGIIIAGAIYIWIFPFIEKAKKWYHQLIIGFFPSIIGLLLLFFFLSTSYDCIDHLTFKGKGIETMFTFAFVLFVFYCMVVLIITILIAEHNDSQLKKKKNIIKQDELDQKVNESVEKVNKYKYVYLWCFIVCLIILIIYISMTQTIELTISLEKSASLEKEVSNLQQKIEEDRRLDELARAKGYPLWFRITASCMAATVTLILWNIFVGK